MDKISTLNSSQLKDILKWLKTYADMSKKIGIRWRTLFHRTISNENAYKIEYMLPMTQSEAWEQWALAFKKAFWDSPKKENVVFSLNESLLGGIKIFQNDQMVDLSFSKAVNSIKKW